jgi:RNA polymerase sigma factor (sigma-70 family)
MLTIGFPRTAASRYALVSALARACTRRKPLCRRLKHTLVHNWCVNIEEVITRSDTAAQAQLALWVQAMALYVRAGGAGVPDAYALGQRAQAERALGQLYDHTVQRVHALVRRFVHEDSAAQEVTEDVFYQAWLQSPRFDSARGSVMAWLLTMARSRALDAWRKRSAQWVSFDSDTADELLAHASARDTPFDLLAATDTRHALHAALVEVSPTARQMISLAFFQGLTQQDISDHMHLPLGTVKTTLRRALLSLREHLQTTLQADMPVGLSAEN